MTALAGRLSAPIGALRRRGPVLLLYAGSTVSLMVGSAAQLLTFAILARALGVEQFGLLMMVTALTNLAVQVCGLGGTETMVRRVARDPALYPQALGHNLILIGASGAVLVAGLAAALPHFVALSPDRGANAAAVLALVLTNVVLVRWIVLVEQVFIARWQVMNANLVNLGFALARTLAAALACLGFGVASVADWAFWHLGCHLLVAGACALALRRFGGPRWTLMPGEVRLGAYFSTPFIVQALRQNADLLVLTAVTSAEVVGAFSVARRIVDTSFLAVNALMRLAYPRLAVASERGLRAALPLTFKVLGATTAIAAGTAVAVYLVAPAMPWLFGKDFGGMVGYLRIMCWALILVTVHDVAAETLGASGRHGIRAALYNLGGLAGAALVALLTYEYQVTGTFVALYAVEGMLAVAFWAALMRLVAREPVASTPSPTRA